MRCKKKLTKKKEQLSSQHILEEYTYACLVTFLIPTVKLNTKVVEEVVHLAVLLSLSENHYRMMQLQRPGNRSEAQCTTHDRVLISLISLFILLEVLRVTV